MEYSVFETKDRSGIIQLESRIKKKTFTAEGCKASWQILEIQACLPAISSMRFFYEKLPGLHLVAAGSLLEFALEELPSVGTQGNDLMACQKVPDDLIISLRADFKKYKKRVPELRISEVFESVVQQMGGKFLFTKAAIESNHKQIKEALELLIMTGLVIPVTHTSANGIPLGAEVDLKKRRMLIFDTGVFQRLLGLNISEVLFEDSFDLVKSGKKGSMQSL